MKRLILVFFFIALSSATLLVRGQVAPTAEGRTLTVEAGGLGSVFQPDYAGHGHAQTSPNRLYGIGAFVDVRVNRWVQLEAEGRWLRFNENYICSVNQFGQSVYCQNGENSYLLGPRIAPYTFHKFTPYGKVLGGAGSGGFLTADTFVLAFGGGVDYRLTRRFSLRCFDFEYQQWRVTPTLYPYGGSVGLSYRVF